MEQQTVLLTIIPRAVALDSATLPVSVIVSPRLSGNDHLGAFPDWLNWTSTLKERGLNLVIGNEGNAHTIAIDQEVLEPKLWHALFKEETLVRSYEYKDYSERGLITYPVRDVLSTLKTVYQEAAVELALPDDSSDSANDDRRSNRTHLADMLEGFDVHWDDRIASRWREATRQTKHQLKQSSSFRPANVPLDSEGLKVQPRHPSIAQSAALPFAVFHHMPTPSREDNPVTLDPDTALDFHEALSSLNSYPPLLRALGLVFDLELPLDFVEQTDPGKYKTLTVKSTTFDWEVPTDVPPLETAYLHFMLGQSRLFFTAPLVLEEPDAPFVAAGLVDLNPNNFGLAQVDVDGGMHKTMMTAETFNNPDPEQNTADSVEPERAPHPDVFDPDATLPSLRSGGISLYADERGLQLLRNMDQSKQFNDVVESSGVQSRPFFAEDLMRGYRIDVWDSHTRRWHSLHRRKGDYLIEQVPYSPGEEEGFVQTAAMQPAPGAAEGVDGEDLYLHEAIARWAGWSLSVDMPGKNISVYGDPAKAIPPDTDPTGEYAQNEPVTPFKMTVDYHIINGSLPRLVFGRSYRLRARVVDLAGNSLAHDEPLSDLLGFFLGLPRKVDGQPYLRFEPVNAPTVVIREPQAVTGPGSSVNRLVIRSLNDGIDHDEDPADLAAGDRHLLPPRTSVEMGERLGMFDDATGQLKSDAATWQLIADRDAGELNQAEIAVAGNPPEFLPLEAGAQLNNLPYLPDPLAHGAALRNLPGSPDGAIGKVGPGAGPADPIPYSKLDDPNPRPGSATLLRFNEGDDWQKMVGLRLTLAEPQPGQTDLRPQWDPTQRTLTVYLAKGKTAVVPLSTYLKPDDLKLMGQWEWLRQFIELVTIFQPQIQYLQPGAAVDRLNHVLQRTVEGGHWMINPPLLLTLVHAVQQPIGRPAFSAANLDHDDDYDEQAWVDPLLTAVPRGQTDPVELAPVTAWRRLNATDAYLSGALQVHGASTAQVDIHAEWQEPLDNVNEPSWQVVDRAARIETVRLPDTTERYLAAQGVKTRQVGYYDPENDQIIFPRLGDKKGPLGIDHPNPGHFSEAMPRHPFTDTKRRKIRYSAVATSRYREYFPTDAQQIDAGLEPLDFTRTSKPVVVDVPASARPLAPTVAYVLPTFGWQRQVDTNIKRSVRFGGGLRVYLERPWFSSGEGELLGVALWSWQNGTLNEASRDKFKPFFTQWGMDPIWSTENLDWVPGVHNFADRVAEDYAVSLVESSAQIESKDGPQPGRVDVAGFPVHYDPERQLWFADLNIHTNTSTYMPFVRLALVRYQPHALVDAHVSPVVLADFTQITPDRSVLVTVDPHAPRQLRVVISGVAPRGPKAVVKSNPRPRPLAERPTQIRVTVQSRIGNLESDLAWRDVRGSGITVDALVDGTYFNDKDLAMWAGTVTFAQPPEPGRYRLLIEETEYISADYALPVGGRGRRVEQPGRLIFAETIELDEVLVQAAGA